MVKDSPLTELRECAMPIKPSVKPDSPSVLDYPDTMSQYERESLAAEAKLKAEREKKKQPTLRKA